MITLRGEKIYLRAVEPEDAAFIFDVENDETLWELSHTQTPFSKHTIQQYVQNAHKDIFEVKQLRLIIEAEKNKPLGMIDLFDFDFKNKRAGVGILIKSNKNRQQGFGTEALHLLTQYSFNKLDLHQLYCNIAEDNEQSLKLFQNAGFQKVGLKKDWNYSNGTFTNEYLLQLVKNKCI